MTLYPRYYTTSETGKYHIITVNEYGQPNYKENNKGIIDAFPFCGLTPVNKKTELFKTPPPNSNVCLICIDKLSIAYKRDEVFSESQIMITMSCTDIYDIQILKDIENYTRQLLRARPEQLTILSNYPTEDMDIECNGQSQIKKSSKGENIIAEILTNFEIPFEQEKTFPKLKRKLSLRLDFYFTYQSRKYAIEYDGMQHSRAINHFGGKTSLLLTRERDMIKNRFCQDNEIFLLRIDYRQIDDARGLIESFIGTFSKKVLTDELQI